MSELEFLEGEARVASAAAPSGLAVEVRGGADGRYDVLVGGRTVARFLGHEECLAAILGAGGALAVCASREPSGGVTVVDRCRRGWKKSFRTRDAARSWLMEGLAATDGAEQDHYADMLVELEGGASTLHYN